MKRFLVNCTLFFLLALASIFVLWHLLAIPRAAICRTDATMLLCGNSTVEFGIDDREIPRALNIGYNADHIEYIYAKVKMLRKYNPGIDTVLVAVDDGLLQKPPVKASSSTLHHFYYYDQFTPSDIAESARLSTFDWMGQYLSLPFQPVQISVVLRHMLGQHKTFTDLGVGGYEQLLTDNLARDIEARHGRPEETVPGVPAFTLLYLHRLSDYCRDNGITLIFFTVPRHRLARSYAYREVLSREFPEHLLLDFTDREMPDSCFSDCSHLNARGARAFARILADTLARKW